MDRLQFNATTRPLFVNGTLGGFNGGIIHLEFFNGTYQQGNALGADDFLTVAEVLNDYPWNNFFTRWNQLFMVLIGDRLIREVQFTGLNDYFPQNVIFLDDLSHTRRLGEDVFDNLRTRFDVLTIIHNAQGTILVHLVAFLRNPE